MLKSTTSSIYGQIGTLLKRSAHATQNTAFLASIQNAALELSYLQHQIATMDFISSDCRNHVIPTHAIPLAELKSKITNSTTSLRSHGWEPAATISSLLKLPIADCSLTPSHLYVTIHVPIKRVGSHFNIFELVRIPYQVGESQRVLAEGTQYIARSKEKIIPITSHMLRHCKIEEYGLCYIPRFSKNPNPFSHCAKILVEGGTPSQIQKVRI